MERLVCDSEGRDKASMVTTEENGTYRFPLYWMKNPVTINGFDFEFLTIINR